MNCSGAEGGFRYWAFLCHAPEDKHWARWLFWGIETYRFPKYLVGQAGLQGTVPKRPYPVFREREELPFSSNRAEDLKLALRQSRFLVVICSPHSAASATMNEQIQYFLSQGGENRVICLAVGRWETKTATTESGPVEWLPAALRTQWLSAQADGISGANPFLAEVRRGKDRKSEALLKILAVIAGVKYDELKMRDMQRLQERMNLILAVVVGVLMILGIFYFQMKLEINFQQHIAERERLAAMKAKCRELMVRQQLAECLEKSSPTNKQANPEPSRGAGATP